MWIVLLALRRPYTFVVAARLLVILTPFILLRTPTDIFPAINIPVVSIIWSYTGLDAQQVEQRVIYVNERALTVTVNNIEHIESTSYNGLGVIKVFLQPGASVDSAVAQITAVGQTVIKQMPPGMTPLFDGKTLDGRPAPAARSTTRRLGSARAWRLERGASASPPPATAAACPWTPTAPWHRKCIARLSPAANWRSR